MNIGEETMWSCVRVIKWIAVQVLHLLGKLFSFGLNKVKEKQEMKKMEGKELGL